jgi:hypothetical protein
LGAAGTVFTVVVSAFLVPTGLLVTVGPVVAVFVPAGVLD